MFTLQQAGFCIDQRFLLQDINLQFQSGRVYGLIGHNGSGKSTLLKLLARQHQPTQGCIRLDQRLLSAYSTREYAACVAYLPQQLPLAGSLLSEELVGMGRYRSTGLLGRMQPADHVAIEEALELTGTVALRRQWVDRLSGGERTRVWLAMCLAQQSRFLLLDEPLAALDIRHQLEVLALIVRLSRELKLGVVMVIHDINLAARYCDELVALKQGRLLSHGAPETIMTSHELSQIYGVDMTIIQHPKTHQLVALP
ncbi:ABC transporter ATP-binding protein [Neisseriaceae bacterium ESL0693]|nr:ABC transporter ATP-binding protein [Neisseriaceae bacterium ESL0693]